MNSLPQWMSVAVFAFCLSIQAQTADVIINDYLESIGGQEKLNAVEGLKMKARVSQGGIEIPLEIIQLKDGRQMTVINFQGKELKQGVFDGETLWSHNFVSLKAEKSDAESTENFKLNANDFPDAFINYKEKGYTADYISKESINGTETYKVKLVKEPMIIDGVEKEDSSYYFFDTENKTLVAVQSEVMFGPQKGTTQQIMRSDYQEVGGLLFPFIVTQGLKDGESAPILFDSIEINPQVNANDFLFPEKLTGE